MDIEEAIKEIKTKLDYFKSYPEGTNYRLNFDEEEVIYVETLLTAYEKEKEDNKRLRKCHLQYEEMTGIDLLLPEKEE